MISNKLDKWGKWIVVAITILVYLNIFPNQFVIDDHIFIEQWKTIRDVRNIPQLIKGELPPPHGGVYRPVRSLLYLSYYHIFGTNPIGWHLHSIFVHIASTMLIYLIVEKLPLFKKKNQQEFLAFVTSLLFGLHPIHTEAITYIAASMEMTGIPLMFAAFYFYLSKHQKRTLLMALFALLAFLTYEMTLVLPILIVFYDFVFHRLTKKNWLTVIKGYGPIVGSVLAMLFIRMVMLKITSRGDYLGYSFYHTMLMMPKVMVRYILLLIWPFNISYIHELAPGFESFMTHYSRIESILTQSIFDWNVLGSIGLLLALIGIASVVRKKYPVVTFGIGWFFISLLPVSYIIPQGIALAEKYLYSASFGFVLLLGYICTVLYRNKYKIVVILIITLISVLYGYLTIRRNFDWRNEITFWQKVVAQHPQSAFGWYQLGVNLGQVTHLDEASQAYVRAISFEPQFYEAYFNLGNIFRQQKKKDQAQNMYELALKANPDFTLAQKALDSLSQESNLAFYTARNKLTFQYPEAWIVIEKDENITIMDPGKIFHLTITRASKNTSQPIASYIALSRGDHGLLIKEGMAKGNGRDAWVRHWFDEDHQATEIFLFDDSTVVDVLAWPSNSPLAKQLDTIVSTIELQK